MMIIALNILKKSGQNYLSTNNIKHSCGKSIMMIELNDFGRN